MRFIPLAVVGSLIVPAAFAQPAAPTPPAPPAQSGPSAAQPVDANNALGKLLGEQLQARMAAETNLSSVTRQLEAAQAQIASLQGEIKTLHDKELAMVPHPASRANPEPPPAQSMPTPPVPPADAPK